MTMSTNATRPGIELCCARDAVAAAGETLAMALGRASRRVATVRLAISGGSAAKAMAPLIAAIPAEAWPQVALTWIDERCVPFADAESNRGSAHRQGLIPAGLGHELPLWQDGETVPGALARIEQDLASHFDSQLDVVLLGMGEDGHVASLFPGHPVLAAGGLAAAITDSPKPPPARITLTLPLIQRAGAAVLLATGEGKRAALVRLLGRDPALPASHIDHLVVVTDLDDLEIRT